MQKNGETSELLESRCNGHHKTKRQLISDDSSKTTMSSKKTKPAYQIDQADGKKSLENDQSAELSNKRTLNHENGLEEKDLMVSGENHVKDSVGAADKESDEVVGINSASVSSDGSSDDELLSDAFSPSQESSKFITCQTVTSPSKNSLDIVSECMGNTYLLLTEFEVRSVSYGSSFFPVRLWPKREACRP